MPNFGPPTPNWGFTAPTDNNDGPDFVQGIQTLTTQIDTTLGGVVSESSTYTAANGNIVNCTGSGSFTITSPSAAVNAGFTVFQQGTGVVTVSAASGVIYGPGLSSGGASSFTLGVTGAYAVLVSDGTNWMIVGGGTTTGLWNFITSFGTSCYSGTPSPKMRSESSVAAYRFTGVIGVSSPMSANSVLCNLPVYPNGLYWVAAVFIPASGSPSVVPVSVGTEITTLNALTPGAVYLSGLTVGF